VGAEITEVIETALNQSTIAELRPSGTTGGH
jgi:hypothetical protein